MYWFELVGGVTAVGKILYLAVLFLQCFNNCEIEQSIGIITHTHTHNTYKLFGLKQQRRGM